MTRYSQEGRGLNLSFVDLATGLCIGLMLITIYVSPNNIRLLVLGLGGLTFVFPALGPSPALAWVGFVSRVLVAIGCYVYLRTHRKIR